MLGDALPDETLLLPSRQMPRRSEIVRTQSDLDLPPHSERSAGCRDWLVYALPDVTLASASELDLGLTTLEGTFLGFEWKILVLVSNWNFTNFIGNVSQAGRFK